MRSAYTPSPAALTLGDVDDRRLSSVSAAIDWAKMNNLLGVFLDADLLVRVLYISRTATGRLTHSCVGKGPAPHTGCERHGSLAGCVRPTRSDLCAW